MMIDFLIAGFTNAINHVIHHLLHLTFALVPPPKSLNVHVGRTPLLPTALSINLYTHSHLGMPVPLQSPHAILSAQNLTPLVLIHAKPNATRALVLLVQLRFYVHAGVDL